MHTIWMFVSEILISVSCYILGLRKCNLNKVKKGEVLIPYANILGDMVLFLDCIDEFEKIYPKDEGYNITFLCTPEVKKFLLVIYPQSSLNFEIIDWKRFCRDYLYYLKIVRKYNSVYENVLVPYNHTVTNDFFVRSVVSKNKITQDYDIPHIKKSIFYVMGNHTYTDLLTVNKHISVLERQRILINHLGNKSFKSRMPYIKPLNCENLSLPSSYIVICPTASYPPKCWPLQQFAKVYDYFVEKYKCKVCICGGNEEPDIFFRIQKLVKEPDSLINFVCKTNFSQWIELIRGAKMALCNDSASYHIAAAVRTPVVCIAGDFAYVNAPYYNPDIITEIDYIPVVLYEKMVCEGCKYIGYQYGYGNKECRKNIKKGKKLLCLQSITPEMTIASMESLIKKYNVVFDEGEKSKWIF